MILPPFDTILKLVRASVPQGMSAPDIDPRRIGYLIALWIGLELLAFSLVMHTLGFLATLVLAMTTTLLGLSDIRRLFFFRGRADQGENRNGSLHDSGLSALGAILLILPGFVSDLAGLALKSPSVRAGLAQRWGRRGEAGHNPGDRAGDRTVMGTVMGTVIDLAPHDYRSVDQPKRSPRRRRKDAAK